jgi:hypothetical protein
MCVLTKTLDCTQVAHVYPFALGAKAGTKEHRFFWDHLAIFWSAERIERWEKAIFGDDRRTETLANLMCLGPMTHGVWGKCRFAIKPIELSDDKKKLTVQFFWLAEGKYGPRHLQTPPTQPTNTSASASRTPLPNIETDQYIQSGDIISFTTHDPGGFPLPSIDLLDMQWALHRVSALSGAADIHDEDLDRDDSLDLAPPIYVGDDTYIALLEKEAEEGGEDEQEEMDNNSQAAEGGLLADVPAVVSVPRTGESVPLAVDHGKRHQQTTEPGPLSLRVRDPNVH